MCIAAGGLLPAGGAAGLPAAEPGNAVVVIYNSHVPESRQVAAHYALSGASPPRKSSAWTSPRAKT